MATAIDQGCCGGPCAPTPRPPERSGRWVGIDAWLVSNEPDLPEDFGSVWCEGTETSPFPVSSLHGALSPEDRQDMYESGGWSVEKVSTPRKTHCRFCGGVLDQSTAKPRVICGADDCRRQLRAQQKRRQRKRKRGRRSQPGPVTVCPNRWRFIPGRNRSGDEFACRSASAVVRLQQGSITETHANVWHITLN